jgi:uncharacterized membrane protein HdeD (DUF308 family)
MRYMYRRSTVVFGLLSVGLGVALIVQTLRKGFGIGIVLGVLFIAMGIGRIYLLRRPRGRSGE